MTTYEYLGTLTPESDGDDGQYGECVSTCSDCGALVSRWGEDSHTSWHQAIGELFAARHAEQSYRWEQRDRGL